MLAWHLGHDSRGIFCSLSAGYQWQYGSPPTQDNKAEIRGRLDLTRAVAADAGLDAGDPLVEYVPSPARRGQCPATSYTSRSSRHGRS